MRPKSRRVTNGAVRNPDRTKARILAAAAAEFAAKGRAGARVDAIARRAGSNKRMLYHYFGDKDGLFRATLRAKITERRALFESAPAVPEENLPFRFEVMCSDPEWIRLLGWEALEYKSGPVEEETFRRAGVGRGLKRLRRERAEGWLDKGYNIRHVLLAKMALAMFPVAFPQMARLITGTTVRDPKFREAYRGFLKKFAASFSPGQAARKSARS
jgi:AcrR family transcriptional regulator